MGKSFTQLFKRTEKDLLQVRSIGIHDPLLGHIILIDSEPPSICFYYLVLCI